MKYYSELTKKIYDCESDLIADEESVVKAKQEKENPCWIPSRGNN